MKFITLEDGAGTRYPIVFAEIQNHCDVANAMVKSGSLSYKVADAGFCSVYLDADDKRTVSCWGTSQTVKTQPTKEDRAESERLIARMMTP